MTTATPTMSPLRAALSAGTESVRAGEKSEMVRLLDLAACRPDVIRLGRGEPDIPTPPHIVAAAHRALDEGKTLYTHPAGIPELRAALAHKFEVDNHLSYDPETEIIVTAGVQEALAVTLRTLLNPGDEVLIAAPYYSPYEVNIKLAGGVPVFVPTYERDGFALRPDAIEAAITSRTKLLAVVSPSNPTASAIDGATLEEIAQVAIRHDLVVLSDEIYEKIVYDGFEHVSIATFPGMWERTVVINGFSKAYSMTGFRVGYMAGPADYIAAALEPRHSLSISTTTPSQYAALAALTGPQDHIPAMMEDYTRRRELMGRTLDDLGVTYSPPRGGFYFFANIGRLGVDSFAFCARAVSEYGVLFSPGSMFGEGGEGYVRIGFVQPLPVLEEGLRRFAQTYHSFLQPL